MVACLLGTAWGLEGLFPLSTSSSGDLASSAFYHDLLLCGIPICFLLAPLRLIQYNSPTERFLWELLFLSLDFSLSPLVFCQFWLLRFSFRRISGYLGILSPYCLNPVAEKSLFFLFEAWDFYCKPTLSCRFSVFCPGITSDPSDSSFFFRVSSRFDLHWLSFCLGVWSFSLDGVG